MQRLIGIWRGIFDHDRFGIRVYTDKTEIGIVFYSVEKFQIIFIRNYDIQKSGNDIETNYNFYIFNQVIPDFIADLNRVSFDYFKQWKNDHGDIAFKFLARQLKLYPFKGNIK
eukprot:Opistho-2@67457